MSKCLAAGMIGLLIGMKMQDCKKGVCMNKLKKQALRKMGL